MTKSLNVEIISPEGVLFKDSCVMITLPTSTGELGVMSDHEIIVTNLQQGKINIYSLENKISHSFFVSGGFAKVEKIEENSKLLVLIENLLTEEN